MNSRRTNSSGENLAFSQDEFIQVRIMYSSGTNSSGEDPGFSQDGLVGLRSSRATNW